MSISSGVVFDFFYGPTHGFVKANRAFVAHGGDGFHAFRASLSTIGFEGRVQESSDAPAAKIGMNPDEVYVACGTFWCDKPKQKSHHVPFVLDDAGQLSEFVEINRMRQSACRTAPPSVDDAHDMVEIGLFEGSAGQVVHGASGLYPTRAQVSVPVSVDGAKDLRFPEQPLENMLAQRL